MGARPQPDRVHRGEHSYTVRTAVTVSGEPHEALVDVLLRNKAYCVKKAPETGRLGQVSWKKSGGPANAWVIALDQAACGAASHM